MVSVNWKSICMLYMTLSTSYVVTFAESTKKAKETTVSITPGNGSAVDVTNFRRCHAEACEQLDALCATWEKKMTDIELPASSEEEGET